MIIIIYDMNAIQLLLAYKKTCTSIDSNINNTFIKQLQEKYLTVFILYCMINVYTYTL